jgi:hypothetical protein
MENYVPNGAVLFDNTITKEWSRDCDAVRDRDAANPPSRLPPDSFMGVLS